MVASGHASWGIHRGEFCHSRFSYEKGLDFSSTSARPYQEFAPRSVRCNTYKLPAVSTVHTQACNLF